MSRIATIASALVSTIPARDVWPIAEVLSMEVLPRLSVEVLVISNPAVFIIPILHAEANLLHTPMYFLACCFNLLQVSGSSSTL